jgi:TRAP-type mannitol/chloroaromatic compound transport system substrate-binding protein
MFHRSSQAKETHTMTEQVSKPSQQPQRRRFLGATAAAGAAALAAPMVSVAQSPVVIKMQGAWGAKDIFNEMAEEYVKRVNEMAGGLAVRLRPDQRL